MLSVPPSFCPLALFLRTGHREKWSVCDRITGLWNFLRCHGAWHTIGAPQILVERNYLSFTLDVLLVLLNEDYLPSLKLQIKDGIPES